MRNPTLRFRYLMGGLCGALLSVALPGLAGAQQQPPPYGTVPQQPNYVANQEMIKGTLTGFDGAYVIYMRDDRGFDDHISTHQGTIINPTGLKLVEGMHVTMWGRANGSTFEAYRIDLNASNYGNNYGSNYGAGGGYYPDSGDYGYGGGGGAYYPGGGYGYGYGAPWGVSIGLGWGWGWGGWGWGGPWGWGGYPAYYGYPYYGGYYPYRYGCCGYRYPYYRYPYGYHGVVHGGVTGRYGGGAPRSGGVSGNPGGGMRGGVSGGGGGRAPVTGGGGGRPPHR